MEYEKYRHYTEDQLNTYWGQRMEQRMDDYYEVCRLVDTLKGYYLEQAQYDAIRGYKEYDDYTDFWNSKRPYGSKALAESVAYNLGWDRDRALCVSKMPKWVEVEALRLHALVKERLEGEWDAHTDYKEYLEDHYEQLRDKSSVHGVDSGGVA